MRRSASRLLYGVCMTLNHMTKQWAKFAVLSMALVSAPGAVWAGGSSAPSTVPPCKPHDGGAGMTFKETAPQTYEVTTPKDEREPHCYFTKARIVPAFRDGQGVGLKLFNIQPDSMYAKAGLRNGDVVMSLNGMPLSPAQKALETYEKVKTAPKIDAEVERDGKRLHLTYVVVRKDVDAKR